MNENYLRLIDANLNRLREGIRVVEDIFSDDIKKLSKQLTDDELIEIANRVKAKKGYDFFNEIILFFRIK